MIVCLFRLAHLREMRKRNRDKTVSARTLSSSTSSVIAPSSSHACIPPLSPIHSVCALVPQLLLAGMCIYSQHEYDLLLLSSRHDRRRSWRAKYNLEIGCRQGRCRLKMVFDLGNKTSDKGTDLFAIRHWRFRFEDSNLST